MRYNVSFKFYFLFVFSDASAQHKCCVEAIVVAMFGGLVRS